ncbi:CRISPR-associated endoribonuclease Cas6 [Emticicia sp. TH156]|uniref:CRISPR-associated endoribonuclease Cas6 n=1 Tax=Emticicia sp. TH156 TaxID=2067454 RepID=UPI000C77D3A9|nr:CRISPR-associated endoribonuclease Cas6 [Emticicia sp. TH156]PLK45899.1 CRISPR-associated endoribonuclease Cas6 [Emticicia sp. TH156]
MRFRLTLKPITPRQKLTLNYNHPFSSWIYTRIKESDASYAAFLHQKGYRTQDSTKTFKHFTFSKFVVPQKAKAIEKGDDYMLLSDQPIYITVSFFIDKAAEDFIIGLFNNQQISIYNKKYQADFIISSVESLPAPAFANVPLRFKATSPMVIAEKRADGTDEYLPPTDPRFARYFVQNLFDKYESVHGKSIDIDTATLDKLIRIKLIDTEKMRSKLIWIKQDRNDETKIKGYENFSFDLTAPAGIIEAGFYGGIGKYTSAAGMGFLEFI